jgi:predicted DNA-binding antitoxin AbrB/MazE fold protein
MSETIVAVFENGAFYPVHPEKVRAVDGQRVTLVVQSEELAEPLRLAVSVYDGLSPQDIREIEKIALDRNGFGERHVGS